MSASSELQAFVMLSCRVQSAIRQCFVYISYSRILELDHFMTHRLQRTPPTHELAVRPIVMLALTFKARNSADRVFSTDIRVESSILSYQKQGISFQCLVSEKAYTYDSIHSVQWSTAQL